jgi:hypothetical protein
LRVGRRNVDESPRLRRSPGVVPPDPQAVIAILKIFPVVDHVLCHLAYSGAEIVAG